jgi:Phosphatidylserine/phosphatidylglycerophosphate/cardiolipin synthases and related enzymes
MIAALSVAALRGVKVDIVLPEHVNIPLVKWAASAALAGPAAGCRVFLTPLPFDHAKIMVVDRKWALFGSTNWDPRSLRLNFELDVETYCDALAIALDGLVDERIAGARELTLEQVDSRALPIKIRDGVARLFSPYL